VAEHLGIRHHQIAVDPQNVDIAMVDQILLQFDQPFGDSSAIPTYLICQEIRKHVKVAIGGDGGDEMFGGYPRFRHADLAREIGGLPDFVLSASQIALESIQRFTPELSRKGRRFLRSARSKDGGRLLALSCYTYPDLLLDLFPAPVMQELDNYSISISSNGNGTQSIGGAEFIDSTMRFALPGDYLRKVDFMSSAHGLEVRVPFLGNKYSNARQEYLRD